MSEAAHHALGPSAASRWMNCPGSVSLESHYPDSGSTFADEGSAAHELAAVCLTDDQNADDYLDRVIYTADDGTLYAVTHDMADAVQVYLDMVREIESEHAEWEQKVPLSPWVPGAFGTSDFISMKGDVLTVVDYKHGKGVKVFAKNNAQMQLYALGAMQKFGHLFDINTVNMIICQPRIDNIDSHTISAVDLLTWAEEEVAPAAARTKEENAPLIAGPAQCQWCRAKAECIALAKMTEAEVRDAFPLLDEDRDVDEKYLAHALSMVDLVKNWANAVEAHAIHQLEQGIEVPGYKLVEGRSARKWADEEKAAPVLREIARKRKGLKVGDFFVTKMITAPQAQKVLGKKEFDEMLNDLVTKPTGKPTLAVAEDPRPAIHSADALGFSDITDQQETQELQ